MIVLHHVTHFLTPVIVLSRAPSLSRDLIQNDSSSPSSKLQSNRNYQLGSLCVRKRFHRESSTHKHTNAQPGWNPAAIWIQSVKVISATARSTTPHRTLISSRASKGVLYKRGFDCVTIITRLTAGFFTHSLTTDWSCFAARPRRTNGKEINSWEFGWTL